ncbi:hypothetical protein ACSFA3_06950 [Variovorax sp. RHLX14]|uniref:hypothetical protein n=1 Tax=Variovorax sp. RHLX14 TaxID=1259731 RepID=UPI003F4697CD
MSPSASDIVPISEARVRLAELAETLDQANVVLAEDAITGLRQALAGQFISDDELDNALGSTSAL